MEKQGLSYAGQITLEVYVKELKPIRTVTTKMGILDIRELIGVINYNTANEQVLKFEAYNNACALLDRVKVGSFVNLIFVIKGSVFNGYDGNVKYYTRLQIVGIEQYDTRDNNLDVSYHSSYPGIMSGDEVSNTIVDIDFNSFDELPF